MEQEGKDSNTKGPGLDIAPGVPEPDTGKDAVFQRFAPSNRRFVTILRQIESKGLDCGTKVTASAVVGGILLLG